MVRQGKELDQQGEDGLPSRMGLKMLREEPSCVKHR